MFISKRGVPLRGFSHQEFKELLASSESYGISPLQLAEAASYSHAMVARSSLGLSCKDANILTFASDTLQGAIALATSRQLYNNGAQVKVFLVGTKLEELSLTTATLIQPLLQCGVTILPCMTFADVSVARNALEQVHATIIGVETTSIAPSLARDITDLLNEVSTPLHAVMAPLGIDLEKEHVSNPVFCATTLSLGVPHTLLAAHRDCVGRHYVCDISIPRALFEERGEDVTQVFAEQPVTQIFIASEIKS